MVVRPPPPICTTKRTIEVGVEFITDRMRRRAENSGGGEVSAHPWYHTIELPGGIVTNGVYDHRPLLAVCGLPDDLRGKTALDVGSADGFWSFELERRGAAVTAVDIETTADVDLPAPVAALAAERGLVDPLRDGFVLAKRALGSGVRLVTGSVYDLAPADLGLFDLVHVGDMLVHLRDPLRALERIRSVTGGEAVISDVFDPEISEGPLFEGPVSGPGALVRYLGGWETAGWWLPSLNALVQMVLDAGFADCDVVTTYRLAPRGASSGSWRAVLRARP